MQNLESRILPSLLYPHSDPPPPTPTNTLIFFCFITIFVAVENKYSVYGNKFSGRACGDN